MKVYHRQISHTHLFFTQQMRCKFSMLLIATIAMVITAAPPTSISSQLLPNSDLRALRDDWGRLFICDSKGAIILHHAKSDYGYKLYNLVLTRLNNAHEEMNNSWTPKPDDQLLYNTLQEKFIYTINYAKEHLILPEHKKTEHSLQDEIDKVQLDLQRYYTNLLDMMTYEANNSTLRINESSNHQRSKRGFVDAIGYGLHTLFGTATDEQVSLLQNKLDGVTAVTEKHSHDLKHVEQAINEIGYSLKEIGDLATHLNDQTSTLTYFVLTSALLDKLIKQIDTKAEIVQSLAELYQGYISTTTLPPYTLQILLDNFENRIPFDTIYDVYPFMETVLFHDRIIILLPLTPTNKITYTLTHIIPLPSSKTVVRMPSTSPFVVLADSNSDILDDLQLTTEQEINKCQHNKGTYICHQLQMTRITSPTETCKLSLLNGSTDTCQFHEPTDLTPIIYETSTQNYVFFFNQTKTIFQCDNKRTQKILQKGLYQIMKQCEISTDYFHYSPIKTLTLHQFDFNQDIEDAKTDTQNKLLLHTNITHFDVPLVQVDLDEVTEVSDLKTNISITYLIAFFVTIIITAIITFFIGKFYTDHYVRKLEKNNHELQIKLYEVVQLHYMSKQQ